MSCPASVLARITALSTNSGLRRRRAFLSRVVPPVLVSYTEISTMRAVPEPMTAGVVSCESTCICRAKAGLLTHIVERYLCLTAPSWRCVVGTNACQRNVVN